jgi:hypothetical protein
MASPPDRNRAEIIGVDLPAFLLSKSVCPDPVRAPQHSAEAIIFAIAAGNLRRLQPPFGQ